MANMEARSYARMHIVAVAGSEWGMTRMIEAQGLTMRYGAMTALEKASFQVSKGEVVGLLGPNGAGKSTTMKILTTYLHPTEGAATVGGKSILDDAIAVRQMIGYLPEVLPLYMEMEVNEYLRFVGQARGIDTGRLKTRLEYVVERCKLKSVYHRPVRVLSKGYRQRTALAQALIHDPEVLILDEPTSGLDPRQILDIRELVRELSETKTVILSTHILQEAQAMADRIIIINRGQIVGQGTLRELRKQAHETNRVRFSVAGDKDAVDKALGEMEAVRIRSLVDESEGVCRFTLVGPDEQGIIDAVSAAALEKQWRVVELTAAPYTLEETFLALTESSEHSAKKGGAA